MTTEQLEERTGLEDAGRRRRPLRTGLLILGGIAALGAFVIALFALAIWLFPENEVEGALLGPVGIVVAFLVGVISFFSPCILPLLPGYLSFVSGLSSEEMDSTRGRRRVVAGTSLFVLGFAVVFTALGASAGAVGQFLFEPGSGRFALVNRIAGGIVIVMGLAFLAPSLMRFLEVERRPLMSKVKPGLPSAFPLGLAFAVGWTPCVGPGLGVILTLGAAEGTVVQAMLLLFFFSLGFGVWFILAGLGFRRAVGASHWLRQHTRVLQAVGGTFMLAIGGLLVSGLWEELLAPLRRLINTFAPPV